jgi:hypothetical protein
MFKKLENNRPFLKMAFEGFAGDGKTYTATQVAIGLHKKIKSKKPIAIFDTEKAAKALLGVFSASGIEAVVSDDQRSLKALNEAMQWCEAGNADILIIDSITHVWEEYLQAYMKQKNRSRLEFQDWGIIKPKWKNEFSTPFVRAKIHIIFTGRAGYEYSDERNEDTGKREIFKSGIKMKAETETAFEPDILVLIQKQLNLLGEKKTVTREAMVIKDRTAQIDGKTFVNPTYKDFAPAIDVLLDGIASESASDYTVDTFDDPSSKLAEIRHKKGKIISEIEGVFSLMKIGASVADKQMKAAILNRVFNCMSIDKLDDVRLPELEQGFDVLRRFEIKYNAYLLNCVDQGVNPDNNQIKDLLQDEINNGDPLK